ncbi:MAG: L,D-transpeptidase family protein [Candidatus Hinthialibacter antarcticus]|nr:L,D-transpeptidase family protein [Candidatus Hinthialibacter antarcticus]
MLNRTFFIYLLVLVFLGSLGTAGFLLYNKRVEEGRWNQLHLAESLIESGDVKTAIPALLPVVQAGDRFPGAARALYQLALAYEKGGHKEALEIWNRLVSEYSESEYFLTARQRQASALLEEKPAEARAIFSEVASATDPVLRGEALVGIATSYAKEGNVDKEREYLYELLEMDAPQSVIAAAKDRLTEMNSATLWSPTLDEFSQLYTVEKGDSPIKIGSLYGTTAWYVNEANRLRGSLRIGKRLKVPKEPFRIVVEKESCRLNLLTESGKFIKWYPVGIGEQSYKTPAGKYTIETKQENPRWYKPTGGIVDPGDPDNALGTRWMGIGSSLGVHGTNEPDTIGFRKSAGCIRMYNEDVEELYKIVRLGSSLTIVE